MEEWMKSRVLCLGGMAGGELDRTGNVRAEVEVVREAGATE